MDLNDVAIAKSMESLYLCKSNDDAKERSDNLIKSIESTGINIENYAIAIINFDKKSYTAMVANVNGAHLLVKVSLLGKINKFYVPEIIWAAAESDDDEAIIPIVSTRKLNDSEIEFCSDQGLNISLCSVLNIK